MRHASFVRLGAVCVTAVLSAPAAVFAAPGDWYVDGQFGGCMNGDGSESNPFCNVGDAVDVAQPGDVVHIAPGVYDEALEILVDLTLIGTMGAEQTILSGATYGTDERLLSVTGSALTLHGLTFADGSSHNDGAAISAWDTALHASKCVFERNVCTGQGGALYLLSNRGPAEATLLDCRFTENQAIHDDNDGGAIHASAGTRLDIVRCLFERNHTSGVGGGGGAVSTLGDESFFSACTFVDNTLSTAYTARGAGLRVSGGHASLSRCQFRGNINQGGTGSWGGALAVEGGGDAQLTDCVIAGNWADGGGRGGARGGGVYVSQASCTLTRCTVAGNIADDRQGDGNGGGIRCPSDFGCVVTVFHTIVASNRAPGRGPDCDGTLDSLGFNLISDTADCVITGDETGNQYDVDAGFRDVDAGDVQLLETSPAVEAGDPKWRPRPTLDSAGRSRWLDGDLDGDVRLDLGALEFAHVEFAVSGDATPGGVLRFEVNGTAGLPLLLLMGLDETALWFSPYGTLQVDPQGWFLLPFGVIPRDVDLTVPPDAPVPLDVVLQQLALAPAARSGNLSEAVSLTLE